MSFKKRNVLLPVLILLIFPLLLISSSVCSQSYSSQYYFSQPYLYPETIKDHRYYSFIVAGHTYGARIEENEAKKAGSGLDLGLYSKFLEKIKKDDAQFLVLTGDLSRTSSEESWRNIEKQLEEISLPYYIALGNHDALTNNGENFLKRKYGGTYYQLSVGTEQFIILDSQQERPRISGSQLEFLKKTLSSSRADNIFIFFHELLWNGNERYKFVWPNKGSFYRNMKDSNFWTELYPLLEDHQRQGKRIYVIAGDVGANSFSIPAFYERKENITIIASGMGGVEEENYLHITVNDGKIKLKAVPLNEEVGEMDLENYSLEKVSRHSLRQWLQLWYVKAKEYIINLIPL